MNVGVDTHKLRCNGVLIDDVGVREVCFPNTQMGFKMLEERLSPGSRVVVEACPYSLPLYDYLKEKGFGVVAAHPLRVKAIASARIKTDKIDSRTLAELLKADLIPQAYIPDKEIRDLRGLVSHRVSLVHQRTALKNRIHAVLVKEGVTNEYSDLFGKKGREKLASMKVRECSRLIADQDLELIDELNLRIKRVEKEMEEQTQKYPEIQLLKTMPGVGITSAIILLSEIGEIKRFPSPGKLCSYAGLVPSTYQSGNTTRHGRVIQGRGLMKYALVQAAKKAVKVPGKPQDLYRRLEKKGKNKALVAVARELTVSIYWMLTRGTKYQAYANKKGTEASI
jgi:transposase